MAVFGIDEAGKGPVLGPMVAASVVGDESVLPEGIDDSKRLTPGRREELARAIRGDERIAVGVSAIEPPRIDDPETDMNTLTVAAHAEAAAGVVREGMAGICDAGDVDADRFARRVAERLPDVDLVAEHRADENRSIVSAASVIAKVERDARIDALSTEYGDVGSGYPSDPTTRAFLADYVADHGELPACARTSWQTCEDVLAAADQRTLAEF
ncbi:ribonuclease HII [Halalkalicoccus ordinarius]|uniref:ribonuclease HII n=1 Tax=Halalkalicoccus ordinarius TaxID=3116651 RepID=UPI00300EF6D6